MDHIFKKNAHFLNEMDQSLKKWTTFKEDGTNFKEDGPDFKKVGSYLERMYQILKKLAHI